jgi:F-type H+-transporting ATPase subunit epsilon
VTAPSFRFRIITPLKITEKDIRHIRLRDSTGYFGIMKNHTDFLTIVEPSLCYYEDAGGEEFFLAVDGGILSMRGGIASLTSREVYESRDASGLATIIEGDILKRKESETALRGMLEGIERTFLEKSIAFVKGRSQ